MRAALDGELLLREVRDNGSAIDIGVDDRGVELELGVKPAAEDPELWIVFHCMPTRYKSNNEEE